VPGDDPHKIEKALTFGADCICLDMEDGVAMSRKAEARAAIAVALRELLFGTSERLARINPIGSGLERDDLNAVLGHHPDGLVIPKVESLDQIAWAHEALAAAELDHSWPPGSIRLLIGIETPRGVLNLRELASHPRLDALIFGGEDFAAAIGATRTEEAIELTYARQATLTAAAAFGLQAIDIVRTDFRDVEALRAEALAGAHLGFSGKQVIHPAQVEPVQKAFTPDEATVSRARELIAAFERQSDAGRGAFALDGRMIDRPLLLQAQNVLARAAAAVQARVSTQ
jgi:citrate lyase beta subunit